MKKINAALCSFGLSGKVFHAPFISLHPGLNLYAAWERSKNLVQEYYPETKIYRTFEEILADPLVDLVIINTPSYTHFDMAKQALLAHKHIIVEKPFTATLAQAKELVAVAQSNKCKISVFQNRRWDSDFKTVRSILESGLLGDILEAEIHYDRYNLALSPKAHKETPGPAVGVVYDLGTHVIDQAITLFGMPEKVFADIMITRPDSQVDDYFEILLMYPKQRVRLKSGYLIKQPPPAFQLYGSKGTFFKSRADIQEPELQAGKKPNSLDWGMEPESEQGSITLDKDGQTIRDTVPTLQGNYWDYYEGVYQALTHDQPMPVTGEDGVRVITILEAALLSNKEKRVVSIAELY